ncbi:unnamed protein product [Spirodela intermedia]|nr:unnamed protein product [Spirodela intermedia]CAA6659640.1 unnamed protein product [Spirodela intermedia]
MFTMEASMASWFSVREAWAASSITVSFSDDDDNGVTSIMVLSTVSLLRVRVPVLSLQRTSMPAISSMAVMRLVIAPCSERR